jgi:hypothetical protein
MVPGVESRCAQVIYQLCFESLGGLFTTLLVKENPIG